MNITLTGEHPCVGVKREWCSTIIMSNSLSTGLSVHNATNFTLTNLKCSYLNGVNSVHKLTFRLTNVENLRITSMILDVKLEILNPRGNVFICQLDTVAGLSIDVHVPGDTPSGQSLVNATIMNSTFQQASGRFIDNNHTISLTVVPMHQYNHNVGPVQCQNSSYIVTMHVGYCVFRDGISSLELYFATKTQCNKVVVSNCEFTNISGSALTFMLQGPHHIQVENVHFRDNADSLQLIYIFVEEYNANYQKTSIGNMQFIPNVRFVDCTFVNNTVEFALIICNLRDESDNKMKQKTIGYLLMAFEGQNTFTNNKPQIDYQSDLQIMTLHYVLVELKGIVEIEDNPLINAVVKISPNSKILLHNNSQLRITNNTDSWAQLSVDNNEYSIGSYDGRCVFQFVDDNGMYISEDDLEYFNASIVLSNRGSREKTNHDTMPRYLIFNANLQSCTLTLREGNKMMEEDEKRRFLKLDSWDETTIWSLPYSACSCDITQPEDRNLWDCSSGTITTTVYPGSLVNVALVALGDYGFVVGAKFTSDSKYSTGSKEEQLMVNSKGCSELFTMKTGVPGSNYSFKTNIHAIRQSKYGSLILPLAQLAFTKTIFVDVSTNCPSGFQLSPSNNGTTCDCNQLLSNHHFQCTITVRGIRSAITYKSSTNNYWMGYLGQQLVISDHCPSHYCNTVNSTISTTGLTTEDINTTIQCDPNSNRQGLLCSQCTPGTSSQFGSFRCTQCTFAGLLLVPLGVVAGIGLIIFLFLFNFTVLQGDIIGIAFYANVVGIMDEFLLKYSVRPFYIPMALINLGFGFETCFFDGMDEFSKAIVQFIFPFYLITLIIIITIVSHNFKCRFRFQYFARRSVPVLATIMLLTYLGLINAVIYGLQYTHIYNVDSGTHQLVWLHQPELEYFKGKHIAVGVLCLLTLLLHFLPLTIVTLFADQIKNKVCSRRPLFSHFFDAFQGAFQYPFGFWFGTRLLYRIVLITLNIATNTPVVAYTIFLTTGSILLLQLLMEPFRTDNFTIYRPDPERKITRRDLIKSRISKIFRPKIIDSLYLLNVMLITTVATISTSIGSVYTTVGVCLSISLALAQLIAVTVHHTYHYFPLPESTRHKMDTLRERYIELRERRRERRARRNQVGTSDSTPVQIHYLSASMCFNSEEYPSSSSSSGEESDSEHNRDDETRGETEDETREETTEM